MRCLTPSQLIYSIRPHCTRGEIGAKPTGALRQRGYEVDYETYENIAQSRTGNEPSDLWNLNPGGNPGLRYDGHRGSIGVLPRLLAPKATQRQNGDSDAGPP